jgi:hypothetical protein
MAAFVHQPMGATAMTGQGQGAAGGLGYQLECSGSQSWV